MLVVRGQILGVMGHMLVVRTGDVIYGSDIGSYGSDVGS
jgi:hypothetical protein